MKKQTQKLTVRKETLKDLSKEQLKEVVGGGSHPNPTSTVVTTKG